MSQIRGDDNLSRNVLKSGKAGQMAGASSLVCLVTHQVALPEQDSAPIPYDQLSEFHLGLMVVMVLMVGGWAGEERGGGRWVKA